MTKLTDTQSILLSTAAARDSGSLLPKPATITAPGGAVAKSLQALVTRGLAEERETSDADAVRRTDGDLRFGLFITPAGKAAIGIEEEAPAGTAPAPAPAPAPPPERTTKTATVLALLSRPEGVTRRRAPAARSSQTRSATRHPPKSGSLPPLTGC